MADLSAERPKTLELQTLFDIVLEYTVLSGAQLYQGSGVAIGSAGTLVHASQSGALYTVGRAEQTVLGDGTKTCRVRTGIFLFANSTGHALTIANRFGPCYWDDDQTVGTDSSKLLAGQVVDVSSAGVYVAMGLVLPTSIALTGALLAANNLNDVASASSSAHSLGLGTADSPTFTGLTLTGTLDCADVAEFTKSVTGLRTARTVTSTGTLGAADEEGNGVIMSLTDNCVITLPACGAATLGQEVTVICTAANGAAKLSISPNAADAIVGGVNGGAGGALVSFGGVTNKDAILTKATQLIGDYLTLTSDGVHTWYVSAGQGVWASEA